MMRILMDFSTVDLFAKVEGRGRRSLLFVILREDVVVLGTIRMNLYSESLRLTDVV